MAEVRFRVLGPVGLEVHTTTVPVTSTRQRVVLAMLLMTANHVVTVDKLIDAVWADSPPPSARGQIQICISALRRALRGVDLIHTAPTGYLIRIARDQLDYLMFDDLLSQGRAAAADGRLEEAIEHLDRAVGLWRGPALADVPGRAAEIIAHRLEERRIMAVEDRIEVRLTLGGHRELVDELVSLTTEHPLRERLWGFLMLALYRSGRQAEALSAYRAARKSLVDELGIEPGEQLRHLEHAILAHDTTLVFADTAETPEPTTPAAPPDRPVPQQLPADLPDFVGRAEQVAVCERALSGDAGTRVSIVVCTGAPGSGKSTLALRVAHRLREQFPDGAIYAELLGSTAEPRSTASVLDDFLRAFGIAADAVPDDLDEGIKLLRSVLAARRLLIVFDDVASEQQITDLLPGVPGPAVLITSRHRLAGIPGTTVVDVDMMSAEESTELLGNICGSHRVAAAPAATRELADICGGLPLALRIAGVRLSAHPHWSVATLLERLHDERSRLDEFAHGEFGVRSLLTDVYESSSEPARRLFRLLSVADLREFSTWHGAALADCRPEEAAVLLDQLAEGRLVDAVSSPVTGDPRYRLHGLVRVFASERARAEEDETDCRAAATRVLGALLAFAEEAHLRLYGGNYAALRGSSVRWPGAAACFDRFLGDPLAWFDEERAGLEAGINQAARLGLDELCWELAVAAVTVYEVRGLFAEWRASHHTALEATRRANNRRGRAAVLASLGSLGLAQHSDQDGAILLAALELFEQFDDDTGIGLTLRNLAHLDRIQGRPQQAVERYELALARFRATGDEVAQAHLITGLARTYLDLGRPDKAEALAKESLMLGQRLNNRRLQAQALHRLGEVFTDTGQQLAAKAVFQEALELTRLLGDWVGQTYALNGLGAVLLAQRQLGEAEVYFAEAVEISESSNDENARARAIFGMGQVYAQRSEYERAEHYLVRAANAFAAQENHPWHRRAVAELDAVRRAATRLPHRRIELD